ncbi:MAG: SusD/RagB family nutrient-binding outer membrane lipoprotein [Bacteroidales bacterium]|nr:SusD/RagB family nutrient-binding outer membrane lipoprotein [Bacteroidales bacterium]
MKALLNIKIVFVLALVILMINSCTEGFDELNTRNNLVTEEVVNTDLLFTYVQHRAIVTGLGGGSGTVGNFPGMSVSNANRPFQQTANTGIWSSAYSTYARNLADMIRILENRDAENDTHDNATMIAMGRIMKVWVFARLTDAYGDCPYSESCLPQEDAVYSPSYDTQQSIYEDMFNELNEAVAQLNPDLESFGGADLMYGGDVAKWEKLANSIRLRLALRVRYVDAAMATANMSDLNESNLITDPADNAFIMTAYDVVDNTNPNFNAQYSGLYGQGSSLTKRMPAKTIVDIWQDNYDPRLKVFADTAEASWPTTPGYEEYDYFGYRGHTLLGFVPVEQKYPWGGESTSRWSLLMYAPVWPMPVISAQEVYFALAEAALFGVKGAPADAQDFYEKGVTAALNWSVNWFDLTSPQLTDMFALYRPEWTPEQVTDYADFHTITQAEIDDFVDTATVMTLTGDNEEQLEMIMSQKIAGYYPVQTFEAWCEWRRTGYPRVQVGDDGDDLQGVSPRRYMWPDSEQVLNEASYQEALARIGGEDRMLVKIWWDTNPLAPHEHPDPVPEQDAPYIQ